MASIYLVFRNNKPHAVDDETQGQEYVTSPQDDTKHVSTEKGFAMSPEVRETDMRIAQRVTI